MSNFNELVGLTLSSIERVEDEELIFTTSDGRKFRMNHSQDCCEYVAIESITGSLDDLIGNPILVAEEASSEEDPAGWDWEKQFGDKKFYRDDAQTWTFYKLATVKGHVDIRWYGSSNGYYSTDVSFYEERH